MSSSDDVPTGWKRVKEVDGEKISYGLKRGTICENDTAILYQVAGFGGVEKETKYYIWRHGGLEEPLQSKERSRKIKNKLFKAVNEVLKPHGFKKHRTKQSVWWRKNGDVIQGFNFQRSQSSHQYMVNLTTHKANNINDIDTFHFEMGSDRMDGLFNDGDNHEGRIHIDRLLDFSGLSDGSDTSEEQQIQEFVQILEGFVPLYFDTPKRTEENRQSIRDLLRNSDSKGGNE